MKMLPHTHSCFVCGESNPLGLNLRFQSDGLIVRTQFIPRPEHIGFKDVIHGGILATLLDEIMVWACAVQTKQFAYCAEMNVRFLQPARPAQILTAIGELTANRRRILDAKAELRDAAGEIIATSTGKYMPIPQTVVDEMATDFVDDPRKIQE